MKIKLLLTSALVVGLMAMGVRSVMAANYTLTPATSTVSVGSNIEVNVGIESGAEKVYAADMWVVFDAAKLELSDVTAVANPNFSFTMGDKNIDNTAGTAKIALIPQVSSSLDSKAVTGAVAKFTFRAKATGVAAVSFTCSAGNLNDTNIIDPNSADIVVCTSNQSGSYTITGDSGGDDGGNETAVTTAATTTTAEELPQTGVDGPTIAMILLGAGSLLGAVYFRKV